MNSMPPSISPIFRDSLERQRDEINARVHLLFKRGAKFEPADLFDHFRLNVGPLVDAINRVIPERVFISTRELIHISLDLFEANQLGPTGRNHLTKELWSELLPQLTTIVARDPRRVVGSLCNGLHFLLQYDHSIASNWLRHLQMVASLVNDVHQLMAIGRCAAWVSGFAPFRQQALEEFNALSPEVISNLFGLCEPEDQVGLQQSVSELLARLANDRWVAPQETGAHRNDGVSIREVKVCCDFRGFGGALTAPPTVSVSQQCLLVSDGQQTWKLIADQFGSILVRCEEKDIGGPQTQPKQRSVFVDNSGLITWGKLQHQEQRIARCSSQAFDGQTLAVTIPTSFRVYLFALRGVNK